MIGNSESKSESEDKGDFEELYLEMKLDPGKEHKQSTSNDTEILESVLQTQHRKNRHCMYF